MNDQNFEQQSIELSLEELEEIQGGGMGSKFMDHLPIGIPWPFPYYNQGSLEQAVILPTTQGLLLPAVQK